jgi:Zn finger protein HypA/HybF involved in hydrogenase expression
MPPTEAPRPETTREETAEIEAREPMLFCPVCSERLAQRKCKLFCQKCGYYLSCADYY